MRTLLFAPSFDRATKISHTYYDYAINEMKTRPNKCFDNENATRNNFEKNIKYTDLFAFWDHGGELSLVSQNKNSIVDKDNASLLKGKEIWTVACLSAKEIGPYTIKKGAKLWQGYDAAVSITDQAPFADIFADAYNKGFLERVNNNKSFELCEKKQREKFKESIDLCKNMSDNSGLFFATILSSSLKHLKYIKKEPCNIKKFFRFIIFKINKLIKR